MQVSLARFQMAEGGGREDAVHVIFFTKDYALRNEIHGLITSLGGRDCLVEHDIDTQSLQPGILADLDMVGWSPASL